MGYTYVKYRLNGPPSSALLKKKSETLPPPFSLIPIEYTRKVNGEDESRQTFIVPFEALPLIRAHLRTVHERNPLTAKGAESCPNAVTVDEDELIEALEKYFAEVLNSKKNVIAHVVGEFNRIYRAKGENAEYEKELRAKLAKLQKVRQKYMDMYADDLISRDELNAKIGGAKQEADRLENDLNLVSLNITKGEQLETIIQSTFTTMESIVNVRDMTNAQLRQLIQKIEVDQGGNIDIYLRLLGDIGLDEAVLVHDDYT